MIALTAEEREKVAQALQLLLDLAKREDVEDGLEQSSSGGSIGQDLRYLAGHWGIEIKG